MIQTTVARAVVGPNYLEDDRMDPYSLVAMVALVALVAIVALSRRVRVQTRGLQLETESQDDTHQSPRS
jgi:hypothetical protein